ncbi:MAG: TrmH family RNA methyltransferase, partial [Thermodesulfobacteriota bacterium]
MIIYGKNPVREFLLQPSSYIEEVFLSNEIDRDSIREIIQLAEKNRIKISYLTRYDLTKISETNSHQGIAARISEFKYKDVSEILDIVTQKGEKLLILILDHIEDPQNLGAIIRSVNVLGAHGVIIPKDRSASVTPAVVKASAGAVSYVPISKVVNIVRVIRELKNKGIWIVGAELASPKLIHDEE